MSDSVGEPKYPRGKNPRSLANLRRPWEPGETGNPNGNRGPLITPRIVKLLQMTPGDFFRFEPQTVADIVAMGYVFESMQSGFDRGRTEVIERTDGKTTDHKAVDITERKVETVYVDVPRPELRRVK